MQLKVKNQTDSDGNTLLDENGNTIPEYFFAWGKGLVAHLKVDLTNPVHQYGLQAALPKSDAAPHAAGMLYARVVKRVVKDKEYFYAQLVCDGLPLQRYQVGSVDAKVGLDLGPSNLAVVTNDGVYLERFCDELEYNQAKVRLLQRKLERQHRAGSPECFNQKGQHKSGKCVWTKKRSKAAQQTVKDLAEASRTKAEYRKSLHGNLTNRILSHGLSIHTEDLSKKPWQKLYGKSINFRAPGMAEDLLCRKAESAGGKVEKINPHIAKLSQRCTCGKISKKPLSLRVHECKCGIHEQRDTWSAFLSRHTSVEGVFNPQAALDELTVRQDIGVGRGNIQPNLRVPPAVLLQHLVPKPHSKAGTSSAKSFVRASRSEQHISGLIPSPQASGVRGDLCEANTQLTKPNSRT